MGRPPKYRSDEERLAARRAQTRANVRAYRDRRRKLPERGQRRENGGSVPTKDVLFDDGDEHSEQEGGGTDLALRPSTMSTPSSTGYHAVIPHPEDFSDYSSFARIDLTFGALRQLVYDVQHSGLESQGPKFPWYRLLTDAECRNDVNAGEGLLVKLAAFATAAQCAGVVEGDSALVRLAVEGRHALLKRLQKPIGNSNRTAAGHPENNSAQDGLARVAANEALLSMYLLDLLITPASHSKPSDETRPALLYLHRAGVELVQTAGPSSFRSEVGWWVLRYTFMRVVGPFQNFLGPFEASQTWHVTPAKRTTQMSLHVLDRKASFFEEDGWLSAVFKRTGPIRRDSEDDIDLDDDVGVFWTLCAKVPRLMEQADNLIIQQHSSSRYELLVKLWTETGKLQIHLRNWWLQCRQTFPDDTGFWGQPMPVWVVGEEEELAQVFTTSLWFADRRTAGITIVYWMYAIHLVLLLEDIRPHLPEELVALALTQEAASVSSFLDAGEYPARCICSSVQYMLDSLHWDADPGVAFYSDLPAVALYVAEIFFSSQRERYAAQLRWVQAANETIKTRSVMSRAVWEMVACVTDDRERKAPMRYIGS